MISQPLGNLAIMPHIDRLGPRHQWDYDNERKIAACDSPDGNDRSEKPCCRCDLWKITVHPPQGFAWREWRFGAGENFKSDLTPRCDPSGSEDSGS